MCQANQTFGENIIDPSYCTNLKKQMTTRRLVVEIVQYDDDSRFGCDEVITFDVSS